MKLLDPLEGLIATIRCIEFQIVFMASASMVKWRLDRAEDKGDIIDQIKFNATLNQTYELQLEAYYTINNVLIELLAGHSIVFMLWLLPIITCCFGPHKSRLFKRICEAVAVLAYLRTIFVACAQDP
jgi:hypothetical protein